MLTLVKTDSGCQIWTALGRSAAASDWDDPKDKDRGKGLTCIVIREKVVIKAPEEEKPIGGLIIKLDPTKKPKTINVWSDETSFGKSIWDTLKEPPVLRELSIGRRYSEDLLGSS